MQGRDGTLQLQGRPNSGRCGRKTLETCGSRRIQLAVVWFAQELTNVGRLRCLWEAYQSLPDL